MVPQLICWVKVSLRQTMNLHLKFQFFSHDTPAPDPTVGGGNPSRTNPQNGHFGRARGNRPRGWHTNCDAVGGVSCFLTA